MAPPVLTLQDIHLTFGGKPLLDGAELMVLPGERICLVGRNGSGKSTLLKIAAGLMEADDGERFLHPGATVRYLPQEPDLSAFETVLDYVNDGLAPGDDPYRGQYLLEQLGMTGGEGTTNLSGGEARRAALARTLAPNPDILLLDEPTNHLDLPAIEWLERELRGLKSAILLISHDRRFLETLSQATVWIDRGQTRRLEEGFAGFEAWRDKVFDEEETERHKIDRKLVAEADWLRYGVTARRKRNVRRLKNLMDLREHRKNLVQRTGTVKMEAAEAEKSGKRVAELEGVTKAYGDRVIVDELSLRILRGDRLGIIGPNGAGKTTLLKLITGALEADQGKVTLGTKLELATLDQKRDQLKPGTTLKEALTGTSGDTVTVNGQPRHVIGYMKDFLFGPEQAGTAIERLSGGERGRLMLARALARPSNLLVLDEPTNDLDLETLDLLQELLTDYEGTVLLVSHDRDFLDRVATSVLAFEGDGKWVEYAGGYKDMLVQRKADLPAREVQADKPKKTKTAPSANTGGKQKLSYKQKYALETLPGEMAALEAEIQQLQTKLEDPGFYQRDPDGFQAATEAMTKAQAALTEKEEQWLALEVLREELDSS